MNRFILCLILLASIISAKADDRKYPVSDIPDSLKQGMYAVVRLEESTFEILGPGKTKHNVRYVVTILNEKAKFLASKSLFYDKHEKIITFKGTVYDAAGGEIKKLKSGEIIDQSATSSNTLFDDNRVKYANLANATYPYTVEFEYETQANFFYSIPSFVLFDDDEVSIQKTVYSVIYPVNLKPRFKLTKVPNPETTTIAGNKEQAVWTFGNAKPRKFEPYGQNTSEYIPNIKAGPSLFEYDGYSGNMSTWKEYGKWSYSLLSGRQDVPEETKQKIIALTKDLPTTEQKAKAVYEFLQSKTRYVNIAEGIGGLQPFPASVVDKNGYGDCKALSNYAVSLLAAAGVKGYYTRIRAGEGETYFDESFSSHQTNHVVVSVPNGKDTLWMECTSQTTPFNYMGSFTGDRVALMITEEGGKLVKTPRYSAEQNLQSRTADVTIDPAGNAVAKVVTTYRGIQSESGGLSFLDQFDEQKKWIQENTDIPTFSINSFSMKQKKSKLPVVTVNLDLTLSRFASVSGKRMFLTPNLMNRSNRVLQKLDNRETNVVLRNNYLDIDTVVMHFPSTLYPEFLPTPTKIETKFGEYETTFQFDEGKLIYIRKMKMWKGTFPKEAYTELIDFYKKITKSDNTKIVFLNKT